jgi:hypothetical protein
LKTTTHPFDFSVSENFPNARQVRGWEGGCAYLAELNGVSYVIVDEGTLADFVGEDDRHLLDQLVKIIAFDSEAERSQYVHTQWPGIWTDDAVHFLPWEGDQYRSVGLAGVRLLILGESHYHKGADPGSDFTRSLTRKYVDGTMNHRFWTLVAKSVAGQSTSRRQCQAFWHTVAFYNYIQNVVGVGARIAPTAEMWRAARQPFHHVLKMIAPHAILVLGKRLWCNLPEGTSTTLPIDGQTWPARTYDVANGVYAIATFINHPASLGFLASKWTTVVAALLDQGRSRLTPC